MVLFRLNNLFLDENMGISKKTIRKKVQNILKKEEASKNENIIKARKIDSPDPHNPLRFQAFWYSHYWWIHRFGFYFIAILSVVGFSLGLYYRLLSLMGISIVALMVVVLYVFLRFLVKRDWYEKLPFVLKGWPDVVNHKSFGGDANRTRVWRNCTIKLVNLPNVTLSNEEIEMRKNIFFLFITNIQRSFYWSSNRSSDARIDWEFKNNIAKGSVNTIIIKSLKDFIERELVFIYHEFKTLAKVVITMDQNEFYVDEYRDYEVS